MGVGSNIKHYRELNEWSQERLAEMVGATRGCVSQWENEINKPRMGMIEKLAGVFNVPVTALVAESKGDFYVVSLNGGSQEERLLEAFAKLDSGMKEAAIAAINGMAGM